LAPERRTCVRKGLVKGVGTDVELGDRVEVIFAEGLESGFILGLLADVGLASAVRLDTAEAVGPVSALGLDTADAEGLASAIGLGFGLCVVLAFELGSGFCVELDTGLADTEELDIGVEESFGVMEGKGCVGR
jgi:hypothetical protein